MEFERGVDTQSETTGAVTTDYVPIGTAWVQVKNLRGTESLIDGGVRDEMQTLVSCDYSPQLAALRAKDRGRMGGVIYNIVSVNHVDLNHRTIEVLCRSGLNNG